MGGCTPTAPSPTAPACIIARLASALGSTFESAAAAGPTGTISSTSWAVLPSLLFTIAARSTTTGPVTSMTMRALPGADWPPRNDLTRPTAVSPGCGGSCSMTSGSSTKTRLGLVSEKTWNSTERSSPMMNLVRARSPLSAVSETRAGFAACACGAAASVWPEAESGNAAPPAAPNRNSQRRIMRRGLPKPMSFDPRLTHYEWRDSLSA